MTAHTGPRVGTLAVLLLSLVAGISTVRAQVQTRFFGVGPNQAPAEAFFSDAALQEIRLTISSRDWDALKENFRDNFYYPADLRWRDEVVRNIGIRSRGSGSRSAVKPGLRVDLDRYVTDQTFLGLKSFVLRNNTQDASNMHERLTMLLYKRLGLPAPREAFVKLYINNDYAGVYTIVESVDKAFLRRTFGEDAGYLYEYDYPDGEETNPYYFEYKGPEVEAYVPSPFKPETHENSPRGEMIEQFVWAVNESGDAFRDAMVEYLDLPRFMQYVAVEQFMADNDGFLGNYGISNFYIYRPDGPYPFTFIPWDKSEAFKGGVEQSIFHNLWFIANPNHLMARALEYPDLFDAFLNALLECARSSAELTPGSVGGWLEREIRREYAQIRDAVRTDPVKPFTNDNFEDEIQKLIDFAQRRSPAVVQEVNDYRGVATESRRTRRRLRD